MKPGLPVIYRTNFSTALLLGGLPLGARETLAEIEEKNHASVIRLREALVRWEKGLSWWQRLNWKCGIAPDVSVTLDFVPGDFVDPTTIAATTLTPASPSVPTTVQQVA
jgi:hypothetical protein